MKSYSCKLAALRRVRPIEYASDASETRSSIYPFFILFKSSGERYVIILSKYFCTFVIYRGQLSELDTFILLSSFRNMLFGRISPKRYSTAVASLTAEERLNNNSHNSVSAKVFLLSLRM